MRPNRAELTDLFWRSVWTFVEVYLAVVIGPPIADSIPRVDISISLETHEIALLAAVGAVASLVKNFASNHLVRTGPHATDEPAIGPLPDSTLEPKV